MRDEAFSVSDESVTRLEKMPSGMEPVEDRYDLGQVLPDLLPVWRP